MTRDELIEAIRWQDRDNRREDDDDEISSRIEESEAAFHDALDALCDGDLAAAQAHVENAAFAARKQEWLSDAPAIAEMRATAHVAADALRDGRRLDALTALERAVNPKWSDPDSAQAAYDKARRRAP